MDPKILDRDYQINAALRHGYANGASVGFFWGLIVGLLCSAAVVLAFRAWELYPH